jgi:hypothetical protein
MKDQRNSGSHGSLVKSFEEEQRAKIPDVRFYKTRLSGFWDVSSSLHRFLKEGITTLLFTDVNTDPVCPRFHPGHLQPRLRHHNA